MPDRVEKLIEKLSDTDREVVRAGVIDELGRTGDHRAIRVLIGVLNDEDVQVRWRAVQALTGFSDDAIGPLLRSLETPDRFLRRNVVHALGELRAAEAVEKLIRMLMFDETDKEVQIEVVNALNKTGDDRAVEPLITVLKEDDWELRWRAIHALGRLGDERAVEPLLEMLEDDDRDV
ncbi:MAG: HEAT repeat domain-containing protein, partial [bacterium]